MLSFCYNGLIWVDMIEHTNITTSDGVALNAEIWGRFKQTALIINPAIGVKRSLYHPLAQFLNQHHISVILYNYRGMEDGRNGLEPHSPCGVESWGKLDQSAVIKWVKTEFNPSQLVVLGHSLGGQIIGFAEPIESIDALILVASQKGDKSLWPLSGQIKLFLLWHLLIPMMSRGPSFNPKKLGLGTYPWPAAAAQQWAQWGQQKDYLFNPKFGFDLTAWHQFDQPLLSLGFTDDDLAPEAAIDGLLDEFGKNHDQPHIDKRIIDPNNINLQSIGHFGFFKPKAKSLWQDLIKWLQIQQIHP